MSKRQKRQRIVASDAQWCIDNKDNLTCKAFAEHHTPYWTNSIPARLDTQESFSDYAENVLRGTSSNPDHQLPVSNPDHQLPVKFTPSNVIYRHDDVEDSRSSPSPTTTLRPSTEEREDDSPASPSPAASASSSRDINARPIVPWMFNDSNVAELFQTFQHKVAALSRANLLQIETSIHEILALSHIFLLCPSQHREQMIDVFSRETLYDIHQSFVQESIDKSIDITDGICANVARIIDSVEQKVRSKDEATALLSRLCISLDEHASSVIRGIVKAMTELPLQAIKDKTSIGKYELTTTYFHPILSSILSNPDKQVLLRWTNIETDSSAKKRPDATITKLNQLVFGHSLGFGEAKIAQCTPDKYNLCHDLLRLALFCKETIDKNQLNASLTFQINGFSVVFFLMRLDHDGIYCLYEICKLSFPRSLEELSGFVSLKNLNTLMRISEMFWRMCKPVSAQDVDTLSDKCRPTHPSLYTLIDGTKDRHRACAMRFGD
ncbi:hypothetical protein G6F37_012560 [Rhizopus arrhizus]|nr:hypothetical protein G6F38_011649 [Rhizopus arrhizus]KAG1142888.1 hypothetical protein G6F37_012560 [Rhizopus arrhizus]